MNPQEFKIEDIIEQPQAQVEEPVQVAEEPEIDDITARAIEQGWNPDYDGPNKRSAKEFLENGEKRAPLLAKRVKELEQTAEVLKKYTETLMQSSAETIKRTKEEYEKRIQEADRNIKQAKENYDVDAVETALNEKAALVQEKRNLEQKEQQVQLPPDIQIWGEQNKDWLDDPVVSTYAEALVQKMKAEVAHLPPVQRMEALKARVMQDMPERFQNKNQEQAPKVLTMQRTPSAIKPQPTKLTISNLPAEHKAGYDQIVKAKHFKTPDAKKAFDEAFLENVKAITGLS